MQWAGVCFYAAAYLPASGGKQGGYGFETLRVARHDEPLQAVQQVLLACGQGLQGG